jgi:crotonobetainyl-CoA:carnitine CoA-transferase CaiB-like acyl-CoA transferase
MIEATGPLRGIRVIEFAGQGPGPFAAMMLSDQGFGFDAGRIAEFKNEGVI